MLPKAAVADRYNELLLCRVVMRCCTDEVPERLEKSDRCCYRMSGMKLS